MAEITASLVKELRERTGAGMMECKKALTENNGDIDAAAEWLRKSGLAKADKKASRVAAEGRIAMAQDGGKAVLVEVNGNRLRRQGRQLRRLHRRRRPGRAGQRRQRRRGAEVGEAAPARPSRKPAPPPSPSSARTSRCAASPRSPAAITSPAAHGGKIGVLVEVKGERTPTSPAAWRCTSPR